MENKEKNGNNLSSDYAVIRTKLKSAKKEGLRKGILTTAIISLLVLATSGVIGFSLYNNKQDENMAKMEGQQSSFTQVLTERDSLINDWLVTFDQIEKDLMSIKEKENLVSMNTSNSEVPENRKAQVLEDIKYINTLLQSNKEKIANLSAQLKKSGNTMKGFQDRIAMLETSITRYEADITQMKTALVEKEFEIGQLNTKMTALDLTIVQQNDKLNSQTNTMHEAYLASGTYKDLKEKGILTKEGGFLGLGRKEAFLENCSDSLFEKIDVTEIKTIQVNSKDARLITEHPQSSYEMIHEGDNKIAYIEIKDPDQFWKISKYAVVEIVK
jgi:uncharacterized coiled-coil protein SlyX